MEQEVNQELASMPQPEIFPPLVKRFQSVFIDQLFVISCMMILSELFSGTDEEKTSTLRGILWAILFFVYEPISIVLGSTIGNYIVGIRIRKFQEPEKKINILQSYIRYILKIFLGFISLFTVTSDSHKRAIHDTISGSLLIYKPRK